MFTYRCSSDVDDEADKAPSTSPPPSHACDTISEESDETVNGMTTTAAPTADGQVDKERQVGSSQPLLPGPTPVLKGGFNLNFNEVLRGLKKG